MFSPRTFAFKMKEQLAAWNSQTAFPRDTLLAKPRYGMETYQRGYATEFDPIGADTKPFLPGFYLLNGTGGYDDPANPNAVLPEKVAGVDDIGIVQGSLSMMDQFVLKDVNGEDIISPLNTFYEMSEANTAGLDSTGKPKYYRDSNGSYDDIKRITAVEIEKNTVIVPDVRMVQEGDLLVNGKEDGELHVGIVVGFKNKPDISASLQEWMDSILVVSTRPGFRMANLGVWGNGNGLFGGFTDNPEEYMIRRWLLPASTLNETGVEGSFPNEVINTLHYQRYTHYVEEGRVPWTAESIHGDDRYKKFMSSENGQYVDYRELPPTSYSTNRVNQSLYYSDMGIEKSKMKPTSYSGWRNLITTDLNYLGYHRGFDVVPNYAYTEANDQTTVSVLAPESGKYWLVDYDWDYVRDKGETFYLQIDSDNYLVLEPYQENFFGDVGVLVTNPENPKNGRIYVFMHLYYDQVNTAYTALADKYPLYSNRGSIASVMPQTPNTGVYVKEGQWIGYMGGNHGYDVHTHIEVYEFFPDYETHLDDGEITDIAKELDAKYPTDIDVNNDTDKIKKSFKWQRVDPRTVFKQQLFIPNSNADQTEALISILQNLPNIEYRLGIGKLDIESKFLPWTYWIKITEE